MQLFKKKAYTTVIEETLVLPIDFVLTKTCSGSSLTQIVLDDITGGTGPYYPATDTFADESAALANTTWSTTPNSGSTAVYYPETVAGTYWVAVKDSANTVVAKEIFADCFDPETALRYEVFVSSTTDATMNGVCDNNTSSVWVATRAFNYAQTGDIVFTTPLGMGSVRYNGYNSINPTSQYRKYVSGMLLNSNACFGDPSCTTCSEAIRIASNGEILELGCCNPPM